MEANVKTFKKQFDRELRHVKLILAHQRHHLPVAEWRHLVEQTKESILKTPQEFFCQETPSGNTFREAIEKVFDGFIEDQRLLANQSRKTFERFFKPTRTFRRK